MFVQKETRLTKNVMGAQANIVAHSPHVNKEFCMDCSWLGVSGALSILRALESSEQSLYFRIH